MQENNGSNNEEIWELVVPFMVSIPCSNCKIGLMEFDEEAYDETPDDFQSQLYEHVCQTCSHREHYDDVYPRIDYQKIDMEDNDKN